MACSLQYLVFLVFERLEIVVVVVGGWFWEVLSVLLSVLIIVKYDSQGFEGIVEGFCTLIQVFV